jgi:hypothetical protein
VISLRSTTLCGFAAWRETSSFLVAASPRYENPREFMLANPSSCPFFFSGLVALREHGNADKRGLRRISNRR